MQQIVTKQTLHWTRLKLEKNWLFCLQQFQKFFIQNFFLFHLSFFLSFIFRLQGMSNQLFAKLNYRITIISPSTSSKNNNASGVDTNNEATNENTSDLSSSEVKEEVLAVGNSTQVFAPRIRLKDLYISRISSGGELLS